MRAWSIKRKLSFAIHALVVAIPFGFSTVSAFLFWRSLFQTPWIAAPLVLVIDALALLGLILYVARIESPFVHLRHALPFISIIPLGLELYALLAHNGVWIAGIVTVAVTAILVAIAWKCFTTIERLFIDPIEAARERAREQVSAFSRTLAQLEEMNNIVDTFAIERMRYHAPIVTARVAEQVEYPLPLQVQTKTTTPVLTHAYECPNCGTQLSLGAYGAAKRHGHCRSCKES